MLRNLGTLGLALVCGFAAGQTVVVPNTTMPGTSSPYDNAYNLASQVSITGTVVGIGQSKPNQNMPTNTRLIVQTLGRRPTTFLVELGPQWYVGKQPTRPKLGQWVKVIGSKIVDHGQTKILAMSVELHNREVLALRRANGDPYWADMAAPTQETVAKNNAPAVGTILSSTTFDVNGTQYPGYVVQTTTGPQNVVVMPEQQQNYYYPPVQDYHLGGGLNVISGGYWPVVTTNGPMFMSGTSGYSPNNFNFGFIPHFW